MEGKEGIAGISGTSGTNGLGTISIALEKELFISLSKDRLKSSASGGTGTVIFSFLFSSIIITCTMFFKIILSFKKFSSRKEGLI
jgi:hypothetical protein